MASSENGFRTTGNRLIMEIDTSITIEDVILSDVNKERLKIFVDEMAYREKLIKYGLSPTNKFLFYGDSGCGKTTLGRAMSNSLGYKMLYVHIANAIASDNVAENITEIFNMARGGGYEIFLDEIDSIGWSRDSKTADGDDKRRALNGLFQELDQMTVNNIVVAATNMFHRLDPALKRRFDVKMYFERPRKGIKDTILHFVTSKDFKIIDDVGESTESIIQQRAVLSIYDMEKLAKQAMKKAIIEDTMSISTSEIFRSIALDQEIEMRFDARQ